MERVHFVEPSNAQDLRVVLANTTAVEHDHYAVAYRTQYGETRVIPWLTKTEADRRAATLRKRGYRAVSGPMDV